MAEEIRAVLIIEIMGRPAAHAKKSLENHLEQMKERKNFKLISKTLSKPRKMKDVDVEMYTCFAEVEIETDNIFALTEIIFDYFPSSVEILSPEKLSFDISDATNFLNDLTARLHKYDEVAKMAQVQNQQLQNQFQEKLKEIQGNVGSDSNSNGASQDKKKSKSKKKK